MQRLVDLARAPPGPPGDLRRLLALLVHGQEVGPILLGTACPAHILTPSVTARGVLNMSALAVVQAQLRALDSEADESAIEGVIVA